MSPAVEWARALVSEPFTEAELEAAGRELAADNRRFIESTGRVIDVLDEIRDAFRRALREGLE